MSYLNIYIHYIHLKLGEIIVDIHTYKLCKIDIMNSLKFWFLHYVEIPHLSDCPEGATVAPLYRYI